MTTYKRIKGDYNLTTLTNGAEVTVTTANVLINANANVSGNITGTYFIGDGGFLTNVVAASTYGNSNVAAYLPGYTGNIAADSISATGNVVGGNIIFASGTVSGTGNIYANKIFANIQGNIDAAGNLNEVQFNSAGDQLGASANFTYDSANNVLTVNGGNILGGNVSVSGNVSGNVGLFNDVNVNNAATNKILYTDSNRNIYDTGFSYDSANTEISGTGNITAAYFVGNGSLLTGVVSSYTDSNVVTLLSAFGSNTISTTGNVTAGYVLGNGSQLSGVVSSYTDSNVVTLLSAFGNNVINATGNITGGALLTAGYVSATGNITGGALLTAGYVSATGNITGAYFSGNGAGLTGVVAAGNVGAASQLANGTSVLNIPTSDGNIIGNISGTTGVFVLSNQGLEITGFITATGNVTGGLFIGNGSQLTGLPAPTVSQDITSNGAMSIMLYDGTIKYNNYATVEPSSGNIAGGNISTTGNISGNYYFGNGSQLTGLPASYSNANVATFLASFGSNTVSTTGNVTAGYFTGNGSQLNSIAGANVSGTVANATYATSAGTVTTAAQGNITSVGTLTSLNSSGNVSGANLLTGGIISATGNVFGGNALFSGNLTVNGNVTYINSNVVTINDIAINLANNAANVSQTNNGGLELGPQGSPYVTFLYNSSANTWVSSAGLSATGNVTAGNILTAGIISSTGNATAGNLSVSTGTVTAGNIVNANGNAVGNIGSSSNYFDTVFATATTALYADLAECYAADQNYEPGTVVKFGGSAEVTACDQDSCPEVAGVISTDPAYKMNSGLASDHVAVVALVGRVPVKVQGPVKAGAMMVSAGNGQARAEINPAMGTVIGKAVQSFDGDSGTIEIVVGRL